jgi:hypothetical protein
VIAASLIVALGITTAIMAPIVVVGCLMIWDQGRASRWHSEWCAGGYVGSCRCGCTKKSRPALSDEEWSLHGLREDYAHGAIDYEELVERTGKVLDAYYRAVDGSPIALAPHGGYLRWGPH